MLGKCGIYFYGMIQTPATLLKGLEKYQNGVLKTKVNMCSHIEESDSPQEWGVKNMYTKGRIKAREKNHTALAKRHHISSLLQFSLTAKKQINLHTALYMKTTNQPPSPLPHNGFTTGSKA